jgi:uncharacterized membrane protein YhaH (DUF805 family)
MFSGRVTRRGYLLVVLIEAAIYMMFGVFRLYDGEKPPDNYNPINMDPLSIIVILLLMIPTLIYNAKRFHDFGWSAWSVLLTFVPVINVLMFLMLLFVPGNVGPNKYGLDPRKKRNPPISPQSVA